MTQAVLDPSVEAAVEPEPEARPQQSLPQKPTGITDKTWHRLTTKGKAFVAEYTEHGNALTAYINSGYTSNAENPQSEKCKRNAYNVTKGRWVQTALLEYKDQRDALAQAKKDFALDWIVMELDDIRVKAKEKKDLAVAVRCVELIGKTRGFFSDTVRIDVAQQREYSEAEQLEAARLTRILLLGEGSGGEQPAGDLEGKTESQ